jgi:hypothetical protein
MNPIQKSWIFVAGASLGLLTTVPGQTELEVSSSARPLGLDTVGPVYQAGSDTASAEFLERSLPDLQAFINQNLGESQALNDVSAYAVNPEVLRLNETSDMRLYFVAEGAGYHNSLIFNPDTGGINESSLLVFPDASSTNSLYLDGDSTSSQGMRSASAPLLPGDFVELGSFEAGTEFDFSLIADGANGGTNIWSTTDALNADGIQHAVAFAVKGSPYLLIGFEDLYGGGDRDYNDLLFVLDIGTANVEFLANPEPAVFLLLLPLLALAWKKRRRQAAVGA